MRLQGERSVLENMKERFVLVLVPIATITTIAAADPSQWSSHSGARYTQFVPPTSDGSEVRIHRAEAASDRDAWLRARRDRGPEGVTLAGAYQAVASPQPSVEMAFGRGRRGTANVMVLSVACTTADRRMSYAEVISPEAVFQSDAEDALRIALRECAIPGATSEPAAPAAPATPARPAHTPAPAAPTNTAPAPDTAAARSQVLGLVGDSIFQTHDGVAGYVPIDILLLRSGWASVRLETVLVPGGPRHTVHSTRING